MTAFAILVALAFAYAVTAITARIETAPPVQPMTWTDEALGRVLAALDETAETFDVDDALALANSHAFEAAVRADIDALTNGETA